MAGGSAIRGTRVGSGPMGEHDHGTPPEMSRQMHDSIRGSEFLLIKDAAHIANIEQEAVFNQAMVNFLKKHGG